MEPGHEDREYAHFWPAEPGAAVASMEPGHEDREYPHHGRSDRLRRMGLNGARS